MDVDAAMNARRLADGTGALAAHAALGGRHTVAYVQDTAALWGGSQWSASYLWADGFLWTNGPCWESRATCGPNSFLWSNSASGPNSYLWTNGFLWTDSVRGRVDRRRGSGVPEEQE